jgi:hypothetical protein
VRRRRTQRGAAPDDRPAASGRRAELQ